jgi:hypothetical protein
MMKLQNFTIPDGVSEEERTVISALLKSLVECGNEIESFSTQGLAYEALCNKAAYFTTLHKALNLANNIVHDGNSKRKFALKQCKRTSKISSMNKIKSQIEKLTKEDRSKLIQTLKSAEEEET